MTSVTPSARKRRLPVYTWVGILIIISAQFALQVKGSWIATWLTPIMWTGYILLADGLVFYRRGTSWLTTRKLEFPFLILVSIGVWTLFEAYNLHIQNWLYRGVPDSAWVRNLAYAWSFATIMPGIFLTSEWVYSLLPADPPGDRKNVLASFPDWAWILAGTALVLIPLATPLPFARYLFGAVWLGFIFLLDPINARLGMPSLKIQWNRGHYRTTISLLLGGLLCGLLWEAWNTQAYGASGGHWIYTVPEQLRIFGWHYGQMPLLGMLGFPPFAVELYVIYQFIRSSLGIERFLGRPDW